MFSSHLIKIVVALAMVGVKAEVDWDDLAKDVVAAASRVYIDDFEDVARQYVDNVGRENNQHIAWFDLYGNHEHLASRPQYKPYKIHVTVDRMRYGSVKRTVDRPGYVYTQWFHNSQNSQLIEGQMSKTIQRATSFTWSLEQGLRLGLEVKVSAGVPEVFGASVSVSSEVSLKATQSQTKAETETFTISNTIKVDPQTSVKGEWTITEREMEVEWEADVYIDGYVAIWFDKKHDGHWLWFHPIWMLASGPFQQWGNGVRYRARGTFTGVRGLESILRTYDYPLQKSGDLNFAAVPRNITIVERTVASSFLHGFNGD